LALKHEYRAILGLTGPQVETISENTYDFFEYIDQLQAEAGLSVPLRPVGMRVLYHPPCQLRSHRMGIPALRVLRRIPDLEVVLSTSECCGVAGTYGLKREQYQVAAAVGRTLFEHALHTSPDLVLTDSETCRWWIEHHTEIPARHPLEVLSAALGLEDLRPTAGGG
jgi:glycerol-3-phosphate dehydrogenase subunit C